MKDVRNVFRLKKEINDTLIKDINEAIKDKVIRDFRNLFVHEDEDYCKPLRVSNFWSNNYIKCESNGDKNKTMSIEEEFDKSRSYIKDIINYLKKYDTWKIQLVIAINFMYSKENHEQRVMYL